MYLFTTVFKAAATFKHSSFPPSTDKTESPSSAKHLTSGVPGTHSCMSLFNQETCFPQLSSLPNAMKFRLYFSTHLPCDSWNVVVGVLVRVVVVVGDVVTEVVVVADVVCEVVAVDVAVEVAVDVRVVVADVVGLVVGVVTSQFWNPPLINASVITLNVVAAATQSAVSTNNVLNAHTKSSSPSPAGPRNSPTAAFSAVAVWLQVVASAATMAALPSITRHSKSPVAAGHASSTKFSTCTCAEQS